EDVFPGRRLEDDSRLRPDSEHRRAVLGCDRAAPRSRPGVDDRPGGRIDLVVSEREGRAAAEDGRHLLVVVALVMLLDHPLPGIAGVRVGAEGGDPESPPDRPEDEGALRVADRQLLELVEVDDLVTITHESSRSSSSTTGSISSTPSTRSSRLTFPAQRLNASSRLPS